MKWQPQDPSFGQHVMDTDAGQLADQLRQQSATATARLREHVELLKLLAALRTGQA
jgi:hypothetical protein